MFKVIIFGRRKPGLTREQFISLYENEHVSMATKLVADGKLPALEDYRRNYILHEHPLNIGSVDFDVVTESWFSDQAGFEANRVGLTDPEVAEMVGKDMAALLDMSDLRFVVVDERRGGAGKPGAGK